MSSDTTKQSLSLGKTEEEVKYLLKHKTWWGEGVVSSLGGPPVKWTDEVGSGTGVETGKGGECSEFPL